MIKKFGSSFAVSAAGAAVALGLLLSAASPVASAAGLTEPQIQSILSLLSSFGADASVTSNVDASLHGRPMMPPMRMGTTTKNRDGNEGNDDHKGMPPFGMQGMGSTTASSSMPCFTITVTLSQGSSDANTGGQVKLLQEFLTQHFNLQENIMTGFFGPKTAERLKEFQGEQGLDQVGRVGGLTRAALAHMCGGIGHVLDNRGDGHESHSTSTASTTINHQ